MNDQNLDSGNSALKNLHCGIHFSFHCTSMMSPKPPNVEQNTNMKRERKCTKYTALYFVTLLRFVLQIFLRVPWTKMIFYFGRNSHYSADFRSIPWILGLLNRQSITPCEIYACISSVYTRTVENGNLCSFYPDIDHQDWTKIEIVYKLTVLIAGALHAERTSPYYVHIHSVFLNHGLRFHSIGISQRFMFSNIVSLY